MAFLGLVLGGFFLLTFFQNMGNLKSGPSLEDRLVLLGIGLLSLCFLVACGMILLRARRLAAGAYFLGALGLLLVGGYVGISLVTGWGSYVAVPWSGIMVFAGLWGLAGLLSWFGSRLLKSP